MPVLTPVVPSHSRNIGCIGLEGIPNLKGRPLFELDNIQIICRTQERSWNAHEEGHFLANYFADPHSTQVEWIDNAARYATWFKSMLLSQKVDDGALDRVRQQLYASRAILDLENDWDDCGSLAFEESHWRRVFEFVTGCLNSLWQNHGKTMLAPSIVPVSQGSIDIHWKTAESELLINVPSDPSLLATFYGDNFGRQKVKGSLELQEDDYCLLLWLKLAS
ncbi:MAG TPA: hypothetical protein VGO11_23505 [Chthoniobacteraceae bacterium]|jgi:hypothetical protein|nr:hypothetical protein [Chthoniobacteraceae bacterium]